MSDASSGPAQPGLDGGADAAALGPLENDASSSQLDSGSRGPDAEAGTSFDSGSDASNQAPGDGATGDASLVPLDAASAGDASGDATAPSDASSDAAVDAAVPAPTLPSKGGTCPTFISGDVSFSPAGVSARQVKLWVGASGGGPLILYWHSTNNQPIEAETTALAGVIAQITAAGGVVAAPYTGSNDGTYPWLSTTSESLKVADEIVACAIEKKSIDPRRIHVIGFSAGGLMTSTMSFQRSSYVASVVPYSGGLQGSSATFQDASNKFAALVFYGGSTDIYSIVNFQTTSNSFSAELRDNGNYTALCNHGGGHTIPSAGPVAAWRFFQDHPYGTNPSPYVAAGFPVGVPSYCQTQP